MFSQKIMHGSMLLIGSRITHNMIGIIGFMAVARILTPADIGIVALAMSWRRIAEALVKLPVKDAVVQMKEMSAEDYSKSFALTVYKGLASFFIMLCIVTPALWVTGEQEVGKIVALLSLYPLFMAFENPYFWRWERKLNFLPNASLFVLAQFIEYLVVIAIAIATRSYFAIAIGFVASGLVNLIFSYLAAERRPKFVRIAWGDIWNFSIWMALARGVETLSYQFERIIVGAQLGPAFLGLFRASKKLTFEFLTFADWAYERAVFSGFSRMERESDSVRSAYLFSQNLFLMIIMPIGFFFGVMAEDLVPLLLGDKWLAAIPIAQVVAPMSTLARFSVPAKAAALSTGRTKFIFSVNAVKAVLFMAIMTIGVFSGSTEGYLTAYSAAVILRLCMHGFLIKHLLQIPYQLQVSSLVRTVSSVGGMVGCVMLAKGYLVDQSLSISLQVPAITCVALFSYVSLTYVLWFLAGRPTDSTEMRALGILQGYWNERVIRRLWSS